MPSRHGSKAGEAADARGAFKEAEEGYRQALAVLNACPNRPSVTRASLSLRAHL